MSTDRPATPALLLACSFAFIIVQLDVTIVNVALPRMGADLHASVGALQWVVDAYTLGFAVFLLSAGVMGDKFGARRVFLAGFILFLLASAACALAPTALLLNVARALQGVGAALLVPSSLAILNAAYRHDPTRLAKAIGWWTAAGGVSIAAGPVLGALLLTMGGWRGIFWVNVPICLAGCALAWTVVPRATARAPARHLDVAGQLLVIVALAGLIAAMIETPALGWTHPVVAGGLLLALIAGAAFIAVERRAAAPMLPLRLFASRPFSGAVLFGVLVNFTYYGMIFVLSFYLQRVRGYTVMQAGLAFLPLTGTFIFSNIASGRLVARSGLRPPMVAGGLICGAGYALLGACGMGPAASFLAMLPGLVLIPAGMGLAVPPMTTAILSSVEKEQAGTASAILNTARQVGGAAGVAMFGAIVAHGDAAAMTAGVRIVMAICAILLMAAAATAGWTRPGQVLPAVAG
ncbi:MFS transporter [Duganella sp. FT3S]|uniref:MFS transporter n=1 Tax=Rugamonas fusca TaxID=2758568 RepID=A0A7W2EHR9_9BURK|nr:MFS transporter [Rugamonas fusca]MBA5606133.1 MFS transporter [Rugamonas fusca]